jgi:hypothetical protein
VPIRSRRRQRGQFVQKLQHGAAGGVLLFKGLAILQHGPEGTELLIGILEVATSALLIVAMLRAARRLRHGHRRTLMRTASTGSTSSSPPFSASKRSSAGTPTATSRVRPSCSR